MSESAVVFDCAGDSLIGIVHGPNNVPTIGVIILLAGGPQYRVGAHRQFVTLGRRLAQQGIAVLRFDHRGTGDSSGKYRGFLDMGEDIKEAVNTFFEKFPSLEKIVLWGECESASAAAFYAHTDSRIAGIYMVNPWIRTQEGQAKTYLKHYYWNRLRDPDFWKKLKSGKFSLLQSARSYLQMVLLAGGKSSSQGSSGDHQDLMALPLPERVTRSLQLFSGAIYILTSGNDYIAQEFKDFTETSPLWKQSGLNDKIDYYEMADADHTFSRSEWRDMLFKNTENWVKKQTE